MLVRCCFKTNSYHEECLKAKYKERKMQRLQDVEKATLDQMVELHLKKEGYTQLESPGKENMAELVRQLWMIYSKFD